MSKLYPFPVLSQSTYDYNEESKNGYDVEVRFLKDKVAVKQSLRGQNLVAAMLRAKDAQFCATVSVRSSVYRLTAVAPHSSHGDELRSEQTLPVEVASAHCVVCVRPGVVSRSNKLVQVDDGMGLSSFYGSDDTFVLPPYAWLADGGWWSPCQESALFVTVRDPSIAEGRFRTRLDRDGILRIIISMGQNTYHEVNRNGRCRPAVIVASLTYALLELRAAYEKIEQCVDDPLTPAEDLEYERGLLESAQYLQSYLEAQKIIDWTQDAFNASEAASAYKPLKLDSEYTTDEVEEV